MMTRADAASAPQGLRGARFALGILAFCVFGGVTTETLPVGLLPQISSSFGVSPSVTGLLVSLYAILVAVLAVPLTTLTARLPRKRLLIIATACFVASNLLVAVAPDFAVLCVARALGGVTHAVFFSICIGYATRLVPPAVTGRALALASAGISAGFVLGVPLGTSLGEAIGWRGAFLALAALMSCVLVLVAVRLPPVEQPEPNAADAASRRRRGPFVAVVAANALTYLGHYTLYTYVSVLLLAAGATAGWVGPILLVFGFLGLLGVWVAGPQLDRRPRRSALLVLGLLTAGILGTGASLPLLVPVLIAAAVWNGAFGPVASIYQSAAVRADATSPDLAGAWVVATSNLGIACGAALGGAIFAGPGLRGVAWAAAIAVALSLTVIAARTER
jgi:predicted MFS family arabinose efflux permease